MPQSKSFWEHPIEKLEEALSLKKQITALQKKLSGLFGSDDGEPAKASAPSKRGGKRTMSPATLAKMRASQQARWAKVKGASQTPVEAKSVVTGTKGKKKRSMSPEAREKIAAAQRARWAKTKGTSTATTKAPAAKHTKKKRNLTPEGRARIVAALKARWAAKKKAEK